MRRTTPASMAALFATHQFISAAWLSGLVLFVLLVLLFWLPQAAVVAADEADFSNRRAFGPPYDRAQDTVMGDMNNDGHLDIVVGQLSGEKNTVYLNDGAGNFHTGPLECGITPFVSCFGDENDNTTSVAVGDMDNDGDLDIIAGSSSASLPTAVYLNDGDANFFEGSLTCAAANVRCFGDSAASIWDVAVGDVDGDGSLDIAAASSDGGTAVYLNDGSGTFATGAVNCAAANVQCFGDSTAYYGTIALGDMDNDAGNSLDIVVNDRVFLNDGSGSFYTGTVDCFALPGNVRCFNGFSLVDVSAVTLGDVDGDSDLDIAASNSRDSQDNLIFLNQIGTNFVYDTSGDCITPPAGVICFAGVPLGRTLSNALGDMDYDGDLDVMWGNDKKHDIYFNDGTGSFPEDQKFGENTREAVGMTVGDVTGDGYLEIIIVNSEAQNEVFVNSGGGVFAPASSSSVLAYEDNLQLVAIGDMNGDNHLDIVTANANGNPNYIYLNDGSGTFPTGTPACNTASVECFGATFGLFNDQTQSLALGDVDGDDDLDIITGNSRDDSSTGAGQQNIVYLNDGNANFYNGAVTCGSLLNVRCFGTGNDATREVALADVDGDSDLDIAVANYLFDSAPAGRFREGQQNVVYLNDGSGNFHHGTVDCETTPTIRCFGTGSDQTRALAFGDMDNDGDADIIVGNEVEQNYIYTNDGTGNFSSRAYAFGNGANDTRAVPVGDVDGDGDLDIVTGNDREQNVIYLNNGLDQFTRASVRCGSTPGALCFGTGLDVHEDLLLEDMNGDGTLDIVAPNLGDDSAVYLNDGGGFFAFRRTFGAVDEETLSAAVGDLDEDGLLDLVTGKRANPAGNRHVYLQRVIHPQEDDMPAVLLNRPVSTDNADFFSTPNIVSDQVIDIAYTLADPQGDAVRSIQAFYSPDGGGSWLPAVAAAGTQTTNLAAAPGGTSHTFRWNTFASNFFGDSDNVVFRIEAYPASGPATKRVPGPYQRAYSAATTFPFRVRGTQVQVVDESNAPVAGALVYRLEAGQEVGGLRFADTSNEPFTTDELGYLQGRGEIQAGDQLFAMLPVPSASTDRYTLYYTSGPPTATGINTFEVTQGGVQQLRVSPDHPLILVDLLVSLEWDASNDPGYLELLEFNLARASQHLYDFTNGQMALGQVTVRQNGDDWIYANVVVLAANNVRPFAIQGGIVDTPTTDPQHSSILYDAGQVTMGSTWNRYGNPGTNLGDDWAIILAHELSHYLLYLDDVYLGFNDDGLLISVDTCIGSAMGDVYTDPRNTEFIADDATWQADCADTLTNKTLQRDEWETIQLWYPQLNAPTTINAGPELVPFDFTTIDITAPFTPTDPLIDPTFYLDYAGNVVASSQASAFLLRDDYMVALGSPYGGQNRVKAHGAQPGDRLCAFDRTRNQYGCEIIALGDERVTMEQDTTWTPVIQITPTDLQTLNIEVSGLAAGLPLKAQLYPEYGGALPEVSLTESNGVYTGVFSSDLPEMAGFIQVWVDEAASEEDPRRETMVSYSIGGNPGRSRTGNAGLRGGGGRSRTGNAPVVSADGQMIFFTENPIIFEEGDFYTIQTMAGLPDLPPGRTVIGQGYNLVASQDSPITEGAVSFQYLGNEVLAAGVNEEDLDIYFWDGSTWTMLPTLRDPYYNLASASSQGAGVYVLMASTEIGLRSAGWNLIAYPVRGVQPVDVALASIDGFYTRVYGYDSTDTGDPWKVFDTGFAPFANELQVLEFGQGYWISATQSITLYLESGNLTSLAAADDTAPPHIAADGLPDPPTPYYGRIEAGETLTPKTGMTVQALVNNAVCGTTQTRQVNGQIVYAIDVLAADIATYAACGEKGNQIRFKVADVTMKTTAIWDNATGGRLDLVPPAADEQAEPGVYLPLMLYR